MREANLSSPFAIIRRQQDVDVYSGMGSDDIEEWMGLYEWVSRYNGLNDEVKMTNIVCYPSDAAKTWFTKHVTEFVA